MISRIIGVGQDVRGSGGNTKSWREVRRRHRQKGTEDMGEKSKSRK